MKEKIKKIKNIFKKKKKTQKKVITKKCKCKYRKYIYFFSIILVLYFVSVIFARNIQTFLIFPEVFCNSTTKTKVNFIAGEKEKLIFYFAGNNPETEVSYFKKHGYKIAIFDYTNILKDTGLIHEEAIYNDAEEFYNKLLTEKNINKEDIIILGKEKGSVFASNFAMKKNIDKLILISPISSLYDISRDKLGFAFQKMIFQSDISVEKLLSNFYNKTLIIASNTDNNVDISHGKRIFRSAKGEKYFVELDDLQGEYILESYTSALEEIFSDFIENSSLKNRYQFIDETELVKIIKIQEYNRVFENIDLETDSSLTKFVNNKVAFDDVGYVPENLVPVGGEHIIDSKGGIMKVRKILKDNFLKLADAFYEDTNNNIVVVSAYRSYLYQKGIKDRGCPDNLCAKAGYSEHQSGLALDLYSASSNRNWANDNTLQKHYKWLSENAHKYGFTNTYQKGLEIDGYEIEPWHWRYVGEDLATLLKDNNITFAEFYNEKMISN